MKESHIQKFNTVYQSSDCYYGQELRPEFTDYFANQNLAGMQALDLGCGEGRYTLYLAEKRCHVTAIDRTPAGIFKLRSTAQKLQLPVAASVLDIADFTFNKNQFDIIVAATVLDHLADGLRQRTIDSIQSALKPGGILYVNVFTVSDPGYIVKQQAASEVSVSGVSDTAFCMEYYYKPDELKLHFQDLTHLYYYEGIEEDLSHGQPHHHGWACLLAQKP
ncbi:MAG: class I SAM-dependent methyltransferase [Desulfobacteraceae bacterium]|nr:MAG: class I SAM-dependent methyltransferase [Desulfobacteraceae bacterium]